MISQIKKRVSSYILSEEGKISKHSIILLGSLLTGASLGAILSSTDVQAATHGNSLSLRYDAAASKAIASHTHTIS